MPSATERSKLLPPGPELDALFFETCLGWAKTTRYKEQHDDWWRTHVPGAIQKGPVPPVSTDANACDSWAMRWARENKVKWRVGNWFDGLRAELWWVCDDQGDNEFCEAPGDDWKHAFVRACIAAAEAMDLNAEKRA